MKKFFLCWFKHRSFWSVFRFERRWHFYFYCAECNRAICTPAPQDFTVGHWAP